ncbi:unnamed protein product [Amoebophrya sp. A120]|nr:unnamed protein product [Amoebophrya sp. A120]|eukprot:GSA120T00011036001.1
MYKIDEVRPRQSEVSILLPAPRDKASLQRKNKITPFRAISCSKAWVVGCELRFGNSPIETPIPGALRAGPARASDSSESGTRQGRSYFDRAKPTDARSTTSALAGKNTSSPAYEWLCLYCVPEPFRLLPL